MEQQQQQQQARDRSVSPVAGSRAGASRRPTYHHHFTHRRHYAVRRKLGRASKTAAPSPNSTPSNSIPLGFSDDSIEEVDDEEEAEEEESNFNASLIVPIINVIQDSGEVVEDAACQEILSTFSSINKDLLALPNLDDDVDAKGEEDEEER